MHLHFNQFSSQDSPLEPYDAIGDEVRISYDPKTKMTCLARLENGTDAFGAPTRYLVVSGTSRKLDAWLGVEINVPSSTQHLTIRMRCYPAETVSPSIYYDLNGETHTVPLPDQPANDSFFNLRISADTWQGVIPTEIDAFRIGLMTKTDHWYAIGIISVDITGADHA